LRTAYSGRASAFYRRDRDAVRSPNRAALWRVAMRGADAGGGRMAANIEPRFSGL